jgi:hypothetical protein
MNWLKSSRKTLEIDWKIGECFQSNPNLEQVSLDKNNPRFYPTEDFIMPKKNLLISAALTVFVLVMTAGVVSAYRQVNDSLAAVQATPQAAPVAMDVPTEAPAPTPTEVPVVNLSPQEAALAAANFLGRTDLYSVENASWNGIDAYKVTFSSGDIVYVGMDGQILEAVAPQPVFINNASNNGGGQAPARNEGEHEDHEREHDD